MWHLRLAFNRELPCAHPTEHVFVRAQFNELVGLNAKELAIVKWGFDLDAAK